MLIIPVVKDNINKALKIFKRKFKQTGTLKEVRERKYHTKKTTKRKLAKEKAILKRKYKEDNDE
jgi:small subunit ribosomal protein S21